MKLVKHKSILTTVLLSLTDVAQIFAINNPIPAPRGGGGFDDSVVVGGPIDNYLPFLFFIALVFGIWVINRSKKTSTI